MKTVRRIIPSGLFLLCLAFFSPIIRGRDAHDLLELMHEMYIIIIAAFLRNHSNALIRMRQQLFGMGNAAVDYILGEAEIGRASCRERV